MKYKPISSIEQCEEYCSILEKLMDQKGSEDEIGLLGLLIWDWEERTTEKTNSDPVRLVKGLMEDWKYSVEKMSQIGECDPKAIEDFLDYKIFLPDEVADKFAKRFKMYKHAFIPDSKYSFTVFQNLVKQWCVNNHIYLDERPAVPTKELFNYLNECYEKIY